MGIKLCNRAALLDFPNVIGLNASDSDSEVILWAFKKIYPVLQPRLSQCKLIGESWNMVICRCEKRLLHTLSYGAKILFIKTSIKTVFSIFC